MVRRLGLALALAGIALGALRALGGFGGPTQVDGALLLVLALIGAGLVMMNVGKEHV